MKIVILYLKNSNSKLARIIRSMYKCVHQFHIPVCRCNKPLYCMLYEIYICIGNLLRWIIKFIVHEPLFRAKCEKVGTGLRMEKLPYIQGHGNISLGDNVYLSGKSGFTVGGRHYEDPAIIIGNNTFIGHDCGFSANLKIQIGNNCYIAGGVKISDSDGHPINYLERRKKKPVNKENILPVIIEDDVWIGARVIILKGVTVGARSIVGAGSVVTKSILPDSIAAGNPAKVVKSIEETNRL